MIKFDKKQINLLRGNLQNIAKAVGCTRAYVSRVIYGRVGNKRSGPKADAIRQKATEFLAVLESKPKSAQ